MHGCTACVMSLYSSYSTTTRGQTTHTTYTAAGRKCKHDDSWGSLYPPISYIISYLPSSDPQPSQTEQGAQNTVSELVKRPAEQKKEGKIITPSNSEGELFLDCQSHRKKLYIYTLHLLYSLGANQQHSLMISVATYN